MFFSIKSIIKPTTLLKIVLQRVGGFKGYSLYGRGGGGEEIAKEKRGGGETGGIDINSIANTAR